MDNKNKDFLKWMFTPSAVHSTLMEHDEDYRNDFRKRMLDIYMKQMTQSEKDFINAEIDAHREYVKIHEENEDASK